MNKRSFDETSANKLLNIAKQRLVKFPRRETSGVVGEFANAMGYAGVNSFNKGSKAYMEGIKRMQETMPEMASSLKPFQRKILTTKGGDALTWAKNKLGVGPGFPTKSRKMLDAVIKGHELDETKVLANMSGRVFGHSSMDVILREHNKLTTLPKEHLPVQQLFGELRQAGETAKVQSVLPNYIHGESPRLSRHARRRVMEKFLESEKI